MRAPRSGSRRPPTRPKCSRVFASISTTSSPTSSASACPLAFCSAFEARCARRGSSFGVLPAFRGSRRPSRERTPFHWARGIVVGAFSGLLGGFIFGTRRSAGDFFPLLAGMGVIHSHGTTVFLHFCVAVVIGSAFGLLFQRHVFGFGSSMGWGLGYAILWWFLGPLTL